MVAVDNLLAPGPPRTGRVPPPCPSEVELVVGDVADRDVWDELLARVRPELVVHLAAETGTAQSLTESTRHAPTNVVGTTAMLDAFVRHEALPEHVVLTSSRAIYGEGPWQAADGTVFEPAPRSHAQLAAAQWAHVDAAGRPAAPLPAHAATTHPNPSSVYGSTKLAQELVLRNWSASFSVPLSVFRLQNVYGPGQSPHNPYTGHHHALPPARLARRDARRLRGRRDQPRLRLHRRRGRRPGGGHRAARRPSSASSTSATASAPRSSTRRG